MFGEILLVEDDNEVRNLIIEKLREAGFEHTVYETSDPISALDVFHAHKDKISVVICDYYLPIQNGNDLCKIIKSGHPEVNIICLTGDSSVTGNEKDNGIDEVFYKPSGINEAINRALRLSVK